MNYTPNTSELQERAKPLGAKFAYADGTGFGLTAYAWTETRNGKE